MDRVATWADCADAALIILAGSGREFDSDDLIAAVGHPDPSHGANGGNSAIGSAFQRASRRGVIVAVGVRKSTQPHRKGGMVRIWHGA